MTCASLCTLTMCVSLSQEVSAIFSILSAILHIGNIDFLEQEVKHQTKTVIGDTDLVQIGECDFVHSLGQSLVSECRSLISGLSTVYAGSYEHSGTVAQWHSGTVAQWHSVQSFGLLTKRTNVQIPCC